MGAGCSNASAVSASSPQAGTGSPTPADREARRAARTKLLHKCFNALDFDESGMIEVEEWKRYLVGGGVPKAVVDQQAAKIIASMDVNKDNKISLGEFVNALEGLTAGMGDQEFTTLLAGVVNTCREAALAAGTNPSLVSGGSKLGVALLMKTLADETRVAKLQLCFKALDTDQSGSIDTQEFKKYVSQTGTANSAVALEAGALITRMDANGDKQVSLQEFMCALAEFKNTCDDAQFSRLVEGIFQACSGQLILGDVLKDALK